MKHLLLYAFSMLLCLPTVAEAVVEIPQPGSIQGGVGVLSGIECEVTGTLTARFDGGNPIELSYGSERNDTISLCGDANNGYVLLINYNVLGPGPHTVEIFDDDEPIGSVTFTVVTAGEEFLTGVSGMGTITLSNGTQLTVEWSQAAQGFTIINATVPGIPDVTGTWDLTLSFVSDSCSGIPASDTLTATFTITTQNGSAFSGTVLVSGAGISVPGTVSGSVASNGDFTFETSDASRVTSGCTQTISLEGSGNFLTGSVDEAVLPFTFSSSCPFTNCERTLDGTIM